MVRASYRFPEDCGFDSHLRLRVYKKLEEQKEIIKTHDNRTFCVYVTFLICITGFILCLLDVFANIYNANNILAVTIGS